MKAFALKTFLIITVILLIIVGGTVGSALYWFNSNTAPVSTNAGKKTITIQKGATVADVADQLQKEGIIHNAFAFRLWAKFNGEEITVQSGEHQFSPSMTMEQIAAAFSQGMEDFRVLIKEGLRVEQIAEVFQAKYGSSFQLDKFITLAKPKEGMLFPDTYDFQKNATAEQIVDRLNQRFEDQYASVNGPTDPAKKKETVILASLLEREGLNDQDRSVIAGIIQNRLRISMKLDIDATLQYLADTENKPSVWWSSPSPIYKDSDSPYNTYKVGGLPPTPICNPGLSSLKAALNPQKSNYLYYIHVNGKAYYAKDLDEQNANIAKYL